MNPPTSTCWGGYLILDVGLSLLLFFVLLLGIVMIDTNVITVVGFGQAVVLHVF